VEERDIGYATLAGSLTFLLLSHAPTVLSHTARAQDIAALHSYIALRLYRLVNGAHYLLSFPIILSCPSFPSILPFSLPPRFRLSFIVDCKTIA
jgi:hypothetical protein